MSLGGTRKSALFLAASLVALFAGVAAATDAIGPGDRETVLTAFTRSALHTEFRAGVTELPGVLAIADIGRARLYMVRSLDEKGEVVDQAPREFAYLLDTLVFDPATYPAFAGPGAEVLGLLGKGEVVLGATSAKLRGLGPGGRLVMADGTSRVVRAIVDDALIQNREVAEAVPGLATGAGPARGYLLVRYLGPLEFVEELFRSLLLEETPVRLRSTEATEFFTVTGGHSAPGPNEIGAGGIRLSANPGPLHRARSCLGAGKPDQRGYPAVGPGALSHGAGTGSSGGDAGSH